MKEHRVTKLVLITMMMLPHVEAGYYVDIIFPRSQMELSLKVDANGHAIKDYDAYVRYPSSFEMGDSPQPSTWVTRGIGVYADINISSTGGQYLATFSLEDSEMGEWTSHKIEDELIRMPSFRSMNVSTTNISMMPEVWITLGGISDGEAATEGFQLRIRESGSGEAKRENGVGFKKKK